MKNTAIQNAEARLKRQMKTGDYIVRIVMAFIILCFGIYIVATNLNPQNGYGIVVGLELMGSGILLALNKFESIKANPFRDK